jgi:hypothetical protein
MRCENGPISDCFAESLARQFRALSVTPNQGATEG